VWPPGPQFRLPFPPSWGCPVWGRENEKAA